MADDSNGNGARGWVFNWVTTAGTALFTALLGIVGSDLRHQVDGINSRQIQHDKDISTLQAQVAANTQADVVRDAGISLLNKTTTESSNRIEQLLGSQATQDSRAADLAAIVTQGRADRTQIANELARRVAELEQRAPELSARVDGISKDVGRITSEFVPAVVLQAQISAIDHSLAHVENDLARIEKGVDQTVTTHTITLEAEIKYLHEQVDHLEVRRAAKQ